MSELRSRLKISDDHVKQINDFILDPNNDVINRFLEVVERYGTPEEINAKARAARDLDSLLDRLSEADSSYLSDVKWLAEQRDKGAFISIDAFRQKVLGDRAKGMTFDNERAVTLEISALQFFPWLIAEAKQAIENGELMPGRFIRVRNMAEQVADNGDVLAVAAAMQIVGASYVETMDTKGTDGSNIHLGGPETITGYFGGIGQPNDHAVRWLDEYLHYYTTYGIKQVLNINPGTVFLGYFLHKLGVDIEFKISVYMGNDNPYAALWTLIGAKLFARPDGTTSLIGFNWSNSVNMRRSRQPRRCVRHSGLRTSFASNTTSRRRTSRSLSSPTIVPKSSCSLLTMWQTSPPSTREPVQKSMQPANTHPTSSSTSYPRSRSRSRGLCLI